MARPNPTPHPMNASAPDMQAVVCHGPKDYRLERVTKPSPGPQELVIQIVACGICASDCKCHGGAAMFWGGNGKPAWVKAPVIPGHEFFGVVVEAGPGALAHFDVAMGDRVIAEQIVPCDKCRYCKGGQYHMCEVHHIFGFQREVADGGMADFMKLPATSRVHKIPESLSLDDAAMIEPMACAVHTVNRADVQLDDVVVIAGAGPLGLGMVQIAHLKTPKKLVIVDPVAERRALALAFGADVAIDPLTEDARAIVDGLTAGYGCDVYIETTGVPVGVTQGLELIRKQGRFVEFSVFGKETSADWSIIGDRKELDVRGSHLGPNCYPIVIDLMVRGLLTSRGIVTHGFPLSDWEQAFALANSLDSIKVLLTPEHAA